MTSMLNLGGRERWEEVHWQTEQQLIELQQWRRHIDVRSITRSDHCMLRTSKQIIPAIENRKINISEHFQLQQNSI